MILIRHWFERTVVGLGLLVWIAVPAMRAQGVFGSGVGATTGIAPMAQRLGEGTYGFRPFVGVNGSYIMNLDTLTDSEGNTTKPLDGFGAGIYGGVSGAKAIGPRTGFGLTYRGAMRFQKRLSWRDMQTQTVGMGINHQATERLTLSGSAVGGTSTGGVGFGAFMGGIGVFGGGGLGGFRLAPGAANDNPVSDAFGNPEFNDVVDDEATDTRVYFASVAGNANYRFNSRVSAGVGAVGFIARRDNNLFGLSGYSVNSGVGFVLNSRSYINIGYGFRSFDYYNAFGGVRLQVVSAAYYLRVTPTVNFQAFGGGVRWDSTFVGEVPLDPLLAELLGKPTGLAIQAFTRYSYVAGGEINKQFSRTSLSFFARRGAHPGNGLVLGSERTTAGVAYDFSGTDRWSASVQLRYGSTHGVSQRDLVLRGYTTRASTSYRFYNQWHFRLGAAYRVLSRPTAPNLNQALFYAGIAWSPGEVPLPF